MDFNQRIKSNVNKESINNLKNNNMMYNQNSNVMYNQNPNMMYNQNSNSNIDQNMNQNPNMMYNQNPNMMYNQNMNQNPNMMYNQNTVNNSTNIYYIIGLDPKINNIFSNLLKPFGITHIIHSRIPPETINTVKGHHFTNNILKNIKNVNVFFLFVYKKPYNTFSDSSIWTISHCTDLMFPLDSNKITNKLSNDQTLDRYITESEDWLLINDFYKNYLTNIISKTYPIIAINFEKINENINYLNNLLNVYIDIDAINVPLNITNDNNNDILFTETNNIIDKLNPVHIFPPNIITGTINDLNIKDNNITFTISTNHIDIANILNTKLKINDVDISKTQYEFTFKIINNNSICINITSKEKNIEDDNTKNDKKSKIKVYYKFTFNYN